jgi:Zn-dependent protease
VSPTFLALLGLTALAGAALAGGSTLPGVVAFVFVFVGWIVAVSLHEWGHAYMAHLGGDDSIKARGYLRLDPLKYADPFTSLVFPLLILALGGIGFPGAAVYVRMGVLRSAHWRAATALAGPAMTGVAMLVLASPFMLGLEAQGGDPAFWAALGLLVFIQATAMILNLLPIPGLDGFAALAAYLPADAARSVIRLGPLLMIGLLVVIFTVPQAIRPLFDAAFAIVEPLGVDRGRVIDGLNLFQFWRT